MTPKQQTVGERIVAEWLPRGCLDADYDPDKTRKELAAAIDRAIEQAHRNGMTGAAGIVDERLLWWAAGADEKSNTIYEAFKALKKEIEQARDGRKCGE